MPTYKFEGMDTSGTEVKDSIDAANEEEAQQKVKAMGYFVTKLTAVQGKGGGAKKKKKNAKSRKTFAIGGVSMKMLTIFTRQLSTLQDAGLPVLRSLRILEKQMKPSVLKNALIDVVEDVESGEVGPGHLVPCRDEHLAQVLPEHPCGTGDEPARHQRVTTCWVRAYFASVASFWGRHHASFSRYQSIVAASPSRNPS